MSVLPPGVPSQPPFPSSLPDRGGLCGLTSAEWNLVLKLLLILLFAFLVAFLVARVQSENISSLWLQVQGYAETTRMAWHEELFKHLLSEHDIRNPLITPGSSVARRRHPIVNFILSTLFPSVRGQGSP